MNRTAYTRTTINGSGQSAPDTRLLPTEAGKERLYISKKLKNIHPINPHCTSFVHFVHSGLAYFNLARLLYFRSSRNCCFSDMLETSGGHCRFAVYVFMYISGGLLLSALLLLLPPLPDSQENMGRWDDVLNVDLEMAGRKEEVGVYRMAVRVDGKAEERDWL